jgi:lipoprotein-releasing system ATP-binding protein
MTGSVVHIEGLNKSFTKGDAHIPVLQNLNVEIGASDRLAITGRSGSGKSTFLHVLGLLEAPDSGRLFIDNINVGELNEREQAWFRRSKIGFVFQAHHLLPEHTALGNVALPVRISGYPPSVANARAAILLEIVGLGDRMNHKPGELSGGEQQRTALARALVMGPSLVLADEPTGNLDPVTARGVLDLMLGLNEELGTTLVVVTHSLALAKQFPRHLVLGDHRLQEDDA